MGFFLKFISWFRRNVLKRFRSAPGSLKRGKAIRKKCRPTNFEDILLSGRCVTPGGSGDQHAKNRKRLFSKLFFDTKKIFFFKTFFFQSKSLLLYFKNAKYHDNPTTLQSLAHKTIHKPPP